jgi:Uma2 family endonuclease
MSTFISPARPKIIYPESDGQPIAENTLQFRWIVTIEGGLDALFMDDPNVFVAGDLLWYPVEGKPNIRNAPDVMVVFGRPKGDRGSYMQWLENGIAPQVVFEILSPGNRAGEMERKFQFYERHGVEEYYIYDPDRGDLVGWCRRSAILEEIPEMAGYQSSRLKIRFEPGEGPDNLTIIGADGEPFLTFAELVKERNFNRQRAEEQTRLAEEQTRLAEEQAQRADRLAARLRELGVEPD